ncbi:S41 family peptidase [Bartonella quintana]|uniref:Carboxy-terminal processing protease ctpA n=5 Tax=Bartonella TaxID=773 RepID=A0A0H3LT87_BARQU|nr:S41 family peptidase [Bartonella quintana]AAD04178.1 carboxy-terminal protease [Bartonella quintana]ETS13530.1 carboxy-terminal-processing protease [Bartonella quintana BQ2-D70]ETS13810.1 carboxy-terminal-processing protease [Bartonella quintana JK 73rel]ETS15497.1 carboxy-terminal-processing protease [Bartonella quintana JK 73]ETS17502.1 carboxy-terminal-processing protease [Bartonella quintana JK 7]
MIRKVILLVAGVLLGASSMIMVQSVAANNEGDTYQQLSLFGDIFERVRMQYVTVPDDKKLIENAINGMLTSLDPHSSYMNAEEAKDMWDSTKGEFGGLGIEVTMEKNLVKVVSPMDDTPASKAGILAGDLISKIDGVQTNGQTLNEAVKRMRGAPGTPITLTIIRSGVDKPLEIKVVRDIIKVKAVKYRVEDDIGYLRLIRFSEQTFGDLQTAIKDIQSKIPQDKLKGYVLDLRLNPGGLLNQAVNVSSAFLNKGEIVSTRGRKKNDVVRFDAKPGDIINGKPLIVLINGGSASASEIVAGALQDHRRATILGTQSFGKGSVQTVIPLGENGALRLTTALYYTPAGTSIQGTGITPDIIVEQPLPEQYKDYDVKLGESELKGHIKGKQESNKGSGSAAFVPKDPKDDTQLSEAYKLLRGEMAHAAFPPDPNKNVLKKDVLK